MYDIQGALRRREMAERLKALSRAHESTARTAETPDPPPGPRHLADPATRTHRSRNGGAVQDVVHTDQPSALTSSSTSSSVTSSASSTAAASSIAARASVPSPGAALERRPRGEVLVAVRAPDQTARLDVDVLVDRAVPPPLRSVPDVVTPPGVTLLRDEPAPFSASPAAPVTEPAAATEVTDVADMVDVAAGDGIAGEGSADEVPDDPPYGGSSASTIADLLRHGNSGLFFGGLKH